MFFDLSLEDGSDLNLNHISFLTLTVAHSLSRHLTHTYKHTFASTHPGCCTPTHRENMWATKANCIQCGFCLEAHDNLTDKEIIS